MNQHHSKPRARGRLLTPRNVLGVLGAMGAMVGVLMFLAAAVVGILFQAAGATIALVVLGAVLFAAGLLSVVLGVALTKKDGRGGIGAQVGDQDQH